MSQFARSDIIEVVVEIVRETAKAILSHDGDESRAAKPVNAFSAFRARESQPCRARQPGRRSTRRQRRNHRGPRQRRTEIMTTADEWRDLARRCREAKIPDVEIDAEICIAAQYTGTDEKGIVSNVRLDPDFSDDDLCFAVDGVDDCCNRVPELTGSIDAIVVLIEKTLSGWAWKVGTCSVSDDAWLVPDFNDPVHGARLREQFGWFAAGSIWDQGIDIDRRPPGNVAVALCEAYCAARAAVEDAARVNGAAAERNGQ